MAEELNLGKIAYQFVKLKSRNFFHLVGAGFYGLASLSSVSSATYFSVQSSINGEWHWKRWRSLSEISMVINGIFMGKYSWDYLNSYFNNKKTLKMFKDTLSLELGEDLCSEIASLKFNTNGLRKLNELLIEHGLDNSRVIKNLEKRSKGCLCWFNKRAEEEQQPENIELPVVGAALRQSRV